MTHQVLKEYNTNHNQGATKLTKLFNKYLLMVTFQNGENYSTISNNGQIFDLFLFEMKKTPFAQH